VLDPDGHNVEVVNHNERWAVTDESAHEACETRIRTAGTTIFSRAAAFLESRRKPCISAYFQSCRTAIRSPQIPALWSRFGRWKPARLPIGACSAVARSGARAVAPYVQTSQVSWGNAPLAERARPRAPPTWRDRSGAQSEHAGRPRFLKGSAARRSRGPALRLATAARPDGLAAPGCGRTGDPPPTRCRTRTRTGDLLGAIQAVKSLAYV